MATVKQLRGHASALSIFAAAITLSVSLLSGTATAGFVPNPAQGVVQLSQGLAVRIGYPLVITQPGTYQLVTNLASGHQSAIIVNVPKPGSVTIDLNGLSIIGSGIDDGVSASAGNFVSIQNGTIQNFSTEVDGVSATCIIHGVRIVGSPSSTGFGIRCGANSTITGNTVIDSGASGTRGIAADQSVISNNTVSGWGDGIFAGGAAGSTVTANAVSNNLGNGIDADASYVSGNTVTGNQGVGISDLVGASTVANNTVSNNGSDGIHGSGTTIVGNTVSSNGGYGIHDFVSSSIANNNVTNNTQDGISSVSGNITNNNVFFNTGNGIDDQGGLVNGNTVANNKLVGLNFADVTTNYVNNSVGNNNTGSANVVNGTNRGGNLCYQGTVTTNCP